jgi:hypothetical protein
MFFSEWIETSALTSKEELRSLVPQGRVLRRKFGSIMEKQWQIEEKFLKKSPPILPFRITSYLTKLNQADTKEQIY